MEYLGLWVTRNETQTINKEVEATLNMIPPNIKKVRALIGVLNYYRNI